MPIKMLNSILRTPQLATEIKRHTERYRARERKGRDNWVCHEVTVNILPFSMFIVCARFVMRTCPFGLLSSVIVHVKCFPFERWFWPFFHLAASNRFVQNGKKSLDATKFGFKVHRQRHFNEIHWPFGWAEITVNEFIREFAALHLWKSL